MSHMTMTKRAPMHAGDAARAAAIADTVGRAIEKYRDYHVALDEGFTIFLPNVPQKVYHFTSKSNGLASLFSFDPARPTSLLYRKTGDGYQLVGAMFTAPKRFTPEQLNERVPLSVAEWHMHTNLCFPPRGQGQAALPSGNTPSRFGFRGTIRYRGRVYRRGRAVLPEHVRVDGARVAVGEESGARVGDPRGGRAWGQVGALSGPIFGRKHMTEILLRLAPALNNYRNKWRA